MRLQERWLMPRTNPARYKDPVRATRTTQETARLLGCGAVKVIELIEDGTLQAVKVGNRRQPTVASIERVLGKPIEELERHLEKPLTEIAGSQPTLTGNAA
jgi:excisionase family DNA binding protein